jgi:hypothetical protein
MAATNLGQLAQYLFLAEARIVHNHSTAFAYGRQKHSAKPKLK